MRRDTAQARRRMSAGISTRLIAAPSVSLEDRQGRQHRRQGGAG